MIKHQDQRVGIFVDVQNMYHSARNLYSSHVNFGKILEEAVAGRKLIRAIAYVIKAQNPEEEKFFGALEKQGFEVKMKELQVFWGGLKKADWDVGIVIDSIKLSSILDVIILVTGDGDFVPLVEYLQYHGRQIEIIAFGETTSSRLKEKADEFMDLSKNKRKFLIAARTQSVKRKASNNN